MHPTSRSIRSIVLLISLLYVCLGVELAPVYANIFTVDHLGDEPDNDTGDGLCDIDGTNGEGRCTLRAAIMQANAPFPVIGPDDIQFSTWGTIEILTPLPSITTEISIDGAGGSLTINNVSAGSSRVISINGGGVLTISNITLTGGNTENGAGIVVNGGTLNINSGTRITGNTTAGTGGGIYALTNGVFNGLVNMSGGSIDNNGAPNGAGIYIQGGADLNMSGGSIGNNTATGNGGGIYATGSGTVVTLTGGSINGNNASSGGGIYLASNASLIASNAIISRNAATSGSAIYRNSGSATVSNSTIVCNNDNAIQFNNSSPALNLSWNWWGSSYGPYFSTNTQGLQCSIGDSLNSSSASLANYGISITIEQSTCAVPATGNWLTTPIAGSPTIDPVSTMGRARYCYG